MWRNPFSPCHRFLFWIGGEEVRSFLRAISVLCLTVVMVGSFAVLPVSALFRAAPASTSALDTLATASADVSDYLSSLERWDGGSLAIHPALSDASIPIEVIIQFQGRSLAAEQTYRAEQGFAKLDGAGQQAYVAGVRASHVDIRGAIIAAGGVVRHDYAIVYNGIDAVMDRAALYQISGLPGIVRIQPTQLATLELDNSVPFILGGKTYAQLGADGTGVRIAVIDSGIDYTHAALGGSGDPAAYAANNPTLIEAGTFPTANVVAAIEWAMDPNHDGDTSDHADVINMSLGGAFGRDTEASSIASNAAVNLGVIVVASAGNGGNIPYITGSPAAASGAISVAAGEDPGVKGEAPSVARPGAADRNYEFRPPAFRP